MKTLAVVCVLLIHDLVVSSYTVAADNETGKSDLKPLVIINGADSRNAKPSLQVIRSTEEWKRVWAAHRGVAEGVADRFGMDVDFDRCMVVAIFRGARKSTHGIEISSTSDFGELIRIRCSDLTYQTAGKGNDAPPNTPYAFVVLTKSKKNVIVEANVQRYLGQPPVWKEWMRTDQRKVDQ
jgi:hypothetical protein